jgi:hypothetical protein
MEVVMWVALGASGTVIIATAVVAGLGGLQTWRAFKGVAAAVTDALEELVTQAEATAERATDAAERTARLTAAMARLQGSLATLAVLQAAVGDARAVIGGVRGLVPRK